MGLQIVFEGRHHPAGELVEVLTFHAQINAGRRDGQVAKDGGIQGGVGRRAHINQLGVDGLIIFVSMNGAEQRRHLDEVGTRSANNSYVHCFLFIFMRWQKSGAEWCHRSACVKKATSWGLQSASPAHFTRL